MVVMASALRVPPRQCRRSNHLLVDGASCRHVCQCRWRWQEKPNISRTRRQRFDAVCRYGAAAHCPTRRRFGAVVPSQVGVKGFIASWWYNELVLTRAQKAQQRDADLVARRNAAMQRWLAVCDTFDADKPHCSRCGSVAVAWEQVSSRPRNMQYGDVAGTRRLCTDCGHEVDLIDVRHGKRKDDLRAGFVSYTSCAAGARDRAEEARKDVLGDAFSYSC